MNVVTAKKYSNKIEDAVNNEQEQFLEDCEIPNEENEDFAQSTDF